MYAISVGDWQANADDIGLKLLVAPVLASNARAIEVERGQFDGMAVPLVCSEDRGAAIVEVIRRKYRRHQLRFYYSLTGDGGWKRV